MQFSLLLALVVANVVYANTPAHSPDPPTGNGERLLNLTEALSDAFHTGLPTYDWVATSAGSHYMTRDTTRGLILRNLVDNSFSSLVANENFPPNAFESWVKPDLTKVLWATDYKKQYRNSYRANYYIQDVPSGKLEPLVKDQAGDIQYAQWNPRSNTIAFVRGNNLYIWKDSVISQVTHDGGPDMLYGVLDWVYEEEVFVDGPLLWFSPDGNYLAYLSFDEHDVPLNQFYTDNPRQLYEEFRYPKPGGRNPKVGFHLLDISSEPKPVKVDEFSMDDMIIGEVAWVTDKHSNVIVRVFNRAQDQEKLFNVDVSNGKVSVVRERTASKGWIDNNPSFIEKPKAIAYLGKVSNTSSDETYYLDTSDKDGWNHLYLWPVNGGEAKSLTSGKWEVRSVLKADTARKMVYYTSNEHHSTESHVYAISYETGNKISLVDDTVSGYWTASFTPSGSHYVLNYEGPDVPYQELYSIDSRAPLKTTVDNEDMYSVLKDYKFPRTTYFELAHPDGYTLNVMQRLPANFDPNRKYPVLFTPYNGPDVQQVRKTFPKLDWLAYVSSDPELEFVTWTVDGRGTPHQGRDFRDPVRKQLGKLEVDDQIWAVKKLLADNKWADPAHVAIFGFSYSAYLALKVVEADSGVFTLGLAWAPVTDWFQYDSIYTERYMDLPANNKDGYDAAKVKNFDGFKKIAGGTMVVHGNFDDNVLDAHIFILERDMKAAGVDTKKLEVHNWVGYDHEFLFDQGDGMFAAKHKIFIKRLYQEKMRVDGQDAPADDGKKHQWDGW